MSACYVGRRYVRQRPGSSGRRPSMSTAVDGDEGGLVPVTHSRSAALLSAALRGTVAGVAGVAVMTTAEKVEQALTGRPNSYVPGRALLTLLGRSPGNEERPLGWNHAMHWGTGATLG